jgi:CDI immunity proteins
MLARRSHELLERYRRGEPVGEDCPLMKALAGNVMTSFDRTKTLQELEGQDWGDPTFESSLVTTCHRLRRKRLDDFNVEDLRIMIGQKIGLPFLVPIALERLAVDPFVEGDFYPGDLLAMVLQVDDAYWISHPDLCEQIRPIVRRVYVLLPSLAEVEKQTVHDLLRNANRSLTE